MSVLHANWHRGALHLWAESADAYREGTRPAPGSADQIAEHAFVTSADEVLALARKMGIDTAGAQPSRLALVLPHDGDRPAPSDRLASELGLSLGAERDLRLEACDIPTLAVPPQTALPALVAFDAARGEDDHEGGHELRFWCAAARLALELLEDQRVVPTVQQDRSGRMEARWRPWLSDAHTAERAATLLAAMPPMCRAVADATEADGWAVLEDFLGACVDTFARDVMVQESYKDAIEDRDDADVHVAWLRGLLDRASDVPQASAGDVSLVRGVRQWLGMLEDIGEGRAMRLMLELLEPPPALFGERDGDEDKHPWRLAFHLVTTEEPSSVIDAETIWKQASGKGGSKKGAEKNAELLLSELARASRIWTRLEDALEETAPTGLDLDTAEAYAFLREIRPILEESGVQCLVPDWWSQASTRVGARLFIEGESMDGEGMPPMGDARRGGFGLHSVVNYAWQIALGDQPLSIEAFEALARKGSPLVRLNGRWVEVRREDLETGLKFLKQHPGGKMSLIEALRLAHGAAEDAKGLPILGMDAKGWVAEVFGPTHASERLEMIEQPKRFQGSLRPYQLAGLSWLAFLDRYGLGACLADDMGLGKTIQLIALLQHEREKAPEGEKVGPTLLVCPMSVLGNWHRELTRFAPELNVHVHHGLDRPHGDKLMATVAKSDVMITTYALVARDKESLEKVEWRRVALDEAQHIKNPPTKQTASIRALKAGHRIALTGTPVENRLTELWSIMEFCTPGYLGPMAEFRRRFAVPIERHRDKERAERLRGLVRPFILRRLKTDAKVISDLPPLVESRQHVPLTGEQASLYDKVVDEMLAKVDRAEGLRRRGLVLSALVKLKQICNHPAHYLRETTSPEVVSEEAAVEVAESANEMPIELPTDGRPLSARSGKSIRLMQMLEEVVAAGDRALIFTQYRQMGHLLVAMIRRELDVESLFLHGGTPQAKRDQLVARFQDPEGTAPIFVLSLKAGGVGLNLTAANHVFHYDRWWNPAVENQATDRAFRIGQLRTVNVHKMISAGTLEERIDQMIEQKTELATQIIGAGEQWLTEMSTGQLRDILSLRTAALEEA
ncbi:MAG: DEAD/DEAH box helicase [Phycisphaerales bacterium]|jgi:SNF2 family DNA or RNA helicase